MKPPLALLHAVLLLAAYLLPFGSRAAELNLATLSCDKYENEIVGSPDGSTAADPAKRPDPIDTVMWLFGYSVGLAGEHVMYGDALTSFGFALDALSIFVGRTLLSVAFDFVSQPLTCKIKVQSDRRECPSYTSRSI